MEVRDELLEIEEQLWTGGEEAYRRHLDEECMTAFPSMAGVFTREQVAATVRGPDRWRDVAIDVEGLMQPTADVALLTYRGSARRGEEERYSALVSSGYVRRSGAWKLVFHQQTPLGE